MAMGDRVQEWPWQGSDDALCIFGSLHERHSLGAFGSGEHTNARIIPGDCQGWVTARGGNYERSYKQGDSRPKGWVGYSNLVMQDCRTELIVLSAQIS